MKVFSNKFFISFLILTVLFYGFPIKTAEARGAVRAVQEVIRVIPKPATTVLAIFGASFTQTSIFWGVIGAKVFPCNKTAAGMLAFQGGGGQSGAGVATSLVKNNECGGGGGGGDGNSSGGGASPRQGVAGSPGSPTLQSQTATPTVSSDGNCVTGFTLLYSVTDAYQYGIYRDGALINQGTLNTIVQPSPYNTSFSYTDSNLALNITYKYDVVLTNKNGQQYRYPEMYAYTDCIKLDLKANNSDGPPQCFRCQR